MPLTFESAVLWGQNKSLLAGIPNSDSATVGCAQVLNGAGGRAVMLDSPETITCSTSEARPIGVPANHGGCDVRLGEVPHIHRRDPSLQRPGSKSRGQGGGTTPMLHAWAWLMTRAEACHPLCPLFRTGDCFRRLNIKLLFSSPLLASTVLSLPPFRVQIQNQLAS
jgi:hypothetical protein